MSEVLKTEILEFLEIAQIPKLRINTGLWKIGKRRIIVGDPGFPDILAWPGNGVTIAIECKNPGEELEPKQKIWEEKLKQKGITHIVATKLEDVVTAVNRVRLKKEGYRFS
jgi:hypothetical protein